MHRLVPPGPDVDAAAAVGSITRVPHPDGRPWIGVCMVSSLDGAIAVEGRSGGLSSPADTSMLLALRDTADVVLVGAATVRAEGYGPPRRTALRIAVVTTGRTELDFDAPLFASGAGLLIAPEGCGPFPVPTIHAGSDGRVDLDRAVRALGARSIHVEGGPRLNAALAEADLIDELNLTLSPSIVGGSSARIVDGAAAVPHRFILDQVVQEDDFLFLRYVRRR